jgi:hypothetical protein
MKDILLPHLVKTRNPLNMTSTIDFRTLPISIPSLCIPRVFSNIDEKRVRHIFDQLNMGIIERVVIVSKTTEKGEKFNRVFVHFRRWFSNSNADTARERLLNGKEIKIIYDDPWFWKVSAYRPPQEEQQRASHASHPQKKKPPTLQFEDSDDEKDERPVERPAQRPFQREKRPVERPMQRESQVQRPFQRESQVQRPFQRPFQRPVQRERPVAPISPTSSPPPREKQENQISNPQEPIPVLYHRLTMKPSQVKTPQVKKPLIMEKEPHILEEGEIVEN